MRSTRANIYIKNLTDNFSNIKEVYKNVSICAAVKADAYGHGALQVAKALEKKGCNYFAVATVIEGEELISGGITKPVLLLSLTTPEEAKSIVKLGIEPVVATLEFIKILENEAKSQNIILNVHLKVDTGMGRIGCLPERASTLAQYIYKSENLFLQGLCTHLSTSELKDQKYTNMQLKKFKFVVNEIEALGITPKFIHAANSGGMLMNKDSIFNLIRTGINLYGYPPVEEPLIKIKLKPVMELMSKVVSLRELPQGSDISYGRTYTTNKKTLIATIPIGYADGYFRSLSNIGSVSIKGKLYSIVGNICMDQMMIEVDSDVELYDDVVIIGIKQNEPNAKTISQLIGTITYEILTNVHRVKRYYIN